MMKDFYNENYKILNIEIEDYYRKLKDFLMCID